MADPAKYNPRIAALNPAMSLEAMNVGAERMKPLLLTPFTQANGLGAMSEARWQSMADTLAQSGVVKKAPPAATLFERVLPRHLQVFYEINERLMQVVEARWPGDTGKKRVCSLIEENGGKSVRMANLAVVGAHAVNGVAELHTALLKRTLFPEFDALYPGRFRNKTNGITPRRWLLECKIGRAHV